MVLTSTEALDAINARFTDEDIKSIYIRLMPPKKPLVRVQTKDNSFWELKRLPSKGLIQWKVLSPEDI